MTLQLHKLHRPGCLRWQWTDILQEQFVKVSAFMHISVSLKPQSFCPLSCLFKLSPLNEFASQHWGPEKNAKLGFRPLSISAVLISTASKSSKTRVKCLELPPSLNIIKNVQRFNKCTFEKWVKAHSHLQSVESARLNSVWQSQTNIPARGSPVRASVGR